MTSTETEQRLRGLIAEGEGPTVEYKSSLRWDYKESRVNKDLTKVVVRTLAAFLNSQGGTLLIGVDDDGAPLDIEVDIATLGKKSIDGFELTLRNAIGIHLGEEVDPYVNMSFIALGAKRLAVVTCAPHTSPR